MGTTAPSIAIARWPKPICRKPKEFSCWRLAPSWEHLNLRRSGPTATTYVAAGRRPMSLPSPLRWR